MLDRLKAFWNTSPWYLRILVPALLIFLAYEKITTTIRDAKNNNEDVKTDLKDQQIRAEQQKLSLDEAKSEGKLSELEAEKQEAMKEAEKQDPAQFFNDRAKK